MDNLISSAQNSTKLDMATMFTREICHTNDFTIALKQEFAYTDRCPAIVYGQTHKIKGQILTVTAYTATAGVH